MKKCPKCQQEKLLTEFYKNKGKSDGLQAYCKKCWESYQCSTFHMRYDRWKANAKHRGIEFTVTEPELEMTPKICYYTGVDLTIKSKEVNTISLDRLDNSKGYIPGNVVFCCEHINVMKSNLTHDQFVLLCQMVVNHKNSPNITK